MKTPETPARGLSPVVASRYDDYAFIQKRAARDLLARVNLPPAQRILEVGCGTGIYTELLLNSFTEASIDAVDISKEMLQRAIEKIISPSVRFRLADAEELEVEPYDLITSNAAFQWFRYLPRTIARYANMLTKNGILSFSFFGPETYGELNAILQDTAGVKMTSDNFQREDELAAMLEAGYRDWTIEEKYYSHVFPSLKELLLNIKYTSRWRTDDVARISWDPGTLARTQRIYLERHNNVIKTTYHIYFCRALK